MRMQFRTPHPICKHVWTQSCECHNSRTALNTRCPRMPGSLATKTSSTPNNSSELKNCSTHLAMALQKAMFLCEKKKTMIYYIESLKYILQYDWAIFADEKWQGKAWKWFETKKQCFRSCVLQEKKKKKREVPDFKKFAQCRSTIVLFRHDACDARWQNDVNNWKQLWMSDSWCEEDMLQPHEQKCINKHFLQLRGWGWKQPDKASVTKHFRHTRKVEQGSPTQTN